MLLKFFPTETGFRFMDFHRHAGLFSLLMVLLSVLLLLFRGLDFGIDFSGGVVVEIKPAERVDISRVREALSGPGDFSVQEVFEDPLRISEPTLMIRAEIDLEKSSEQAVQETTGAILDALRAELGEISVRRAEAVGPKVSAELLRDGILALSIALGLMLVYIWFRFEWQFSLGAVLALAHDVLLTIGMFALTGLEFNLSTIAALLTIVGYSMNDTVVVYDRVREEMRRYRKLPLSEIIDMALNRTLSRTLLTSGTTLLALLAIFLFGGSVLRGFSFAMIWGVLVGTWSSMFIASSSLLHSGLPRRGGGSEA